MQDLRDRPRAMKLGLEKKTLIFTVAILLLIFGTFGYLGLQAVQSSTELALNERLALAETVAANIDGAISYSSHELEQMAAHAAQPSESLTPKTQTPAATSDNTCLTMCHDRSRVNVSRVGVTDEKGDFLFLEPHQTLNLDEQKIMSPELTAGLRLGKTVIKENRPQKDGDEVTVTIATPLRRADGTIQGALVMEIDPLDSVSSMISSQPSLDSGYHIQVIDDKGITLAGDSGSPLYTQSEHLLYVTSLLEAKKPGMLTHTTIDANGEEKHIIAFAPLKTLPWGIVVERRPDMVPLLPGMLRQRLFILSGLALLVALVLVWITARRIVKPIATLTLASQKIASGNLEETITLKGEKEMEILAGAFDNMRQKLKASQAEVAGWQKDLENRVEQRTRELSALIDASRELSASLDLERVIEVIMGQARELFPEADAGIVFLWDARTETLISSSSFGFKPEPLFALKSGEDYAGKVFEEAQGITISPGRLASQFLAETSIENLRNLHPDDQGFEAREVMAVPLIYQTKPIGSLVLYNLDGALTFSPPGLHLLQGLANQGAIAIENSRLFKEAALVGTLRELERMKTEFVARASHELRTPLTSIKSLVETLLRPELRLKPREQREFLESINTASDRLARIITDLLTISKIEAGKLDVRPMPTSVGAVVSRVVDEFRPQAGQRKITVQVPTDLSNVMADPDKLADVLTNLLVNSVKYSPPDSAILVKAENAGIETPSPGLAAARPGVIVSVTDEGAGIPLEEQTKLFHRFSRADTPSQRTVPGVGLGLYICRSYIEAMGGRIWVKSAPGAGATFSFTLPATDQAPTSSRPDRLSAPPGRMAQVPARPGLNGKTILVVDDEPDVTRAVAVNLGARGYKVLAAHKGEEGLDLARQRKPDAIILDVMLPDINGLEIARRLKGDPDTAGIPIIFLSARAQKDDQVRGLEAGGAVYITKPFSNEELCSTVETLVH